MNENNSSIKTDKHSRFVFYDDFSTIYDSTLLAVVRE